MNEQRKRFEKAIMEFFSHFPDGEWKDAAIKVAVEDPFCLGFDAPKEPEYIRWWAAEAGVHMNPYFRGLGRAEKEQFEYWKDQLPAY